MVTSDSDTQRWPSSFGRSSDTLASLQPWIGTAPILSRIVTPTPNCANAKRRRSEALSRRSGLHVITFAARSDASDPLFMPARYTRLPCAEHRERGNAAVAY